jgi:hypothetical protein
MDMHRDNPSLINYSSVRICPASPSSFRFLRLRKSYLGFPFFFCYIVSKIQLGKSREQIGLEKECEPHHRVLHL